MTSTVIDIDSLDAIGISRRDICAPAVAQTNADASVGAAVPHSQKRYPDLTSGQNDTKLQTYRPECSMYLSTWVCAVCLKIGRDYRREFCRIPTEEEIRRGNPIDGIEVG